MAEDQDKSQKTEDPTPKKLEDAIKRGQVAFSREVTTFIMLVMLSIFILGIAPELFRVANFELAAYVVSPHDFGSDFDGDDIMRLTIKILMELAVLASIPLAISWIGTLLSSFIQNGVIYSPEAITPKLAKINPLNGLKRLFSQKAIVEFVKGLFKISIIGLASYLAVKSDLDNLELFINMDLSGVFDVLHSMLLKMLVTICICMAIIAGLDLAYQKYDHFQSLKMTKQEVKDEMKQAEGNPEVKAKLKSLRVEKLKKGMILEVPKATVIITNPTHFSIALLYESGKMEAPKVTAKGADIIALRIREIAKENNVPIVEDPPLARALYANVEIDEEIPMEHYKAVAKILTKFMNFNFN